MTISEYQQKLRQGMKNMKDEDFLRQRCKELFPGTDFTLEVKGTTVSITGLSEEQHQRFQEELIKIGTGQ